MLALPDRRMLDRIVRGRAWIPMLGILLVAIVGMRVEVLKLGAGVGRSMNRASVLQSQNELLRESVSALSSDDRIEALATQMGMTMPGPMDVHFIAAKSGTASRAGSSIVAPDPASFRDSVQTEQSADASSAITAPQSSAAGTYAPDGTVVADAASTAGTSAGVPAATVGSTAASTGAAVDSAASTAATSTAPQTSTVPETSTAPDTSTVPAASTTPATSTAPETVTAPETSTAPDTAAVDTGAVSASDVSNGGATSTAPTTGGTGLAG